MGKDVALEGPLARGDAGPEHWGRQRMQRGRVATGAALDQALHDRHVALVHQAVYRFLIGCVQADQ
jgi:hypothetical protein